jgi:hypothetical protein
VELVAASSPLCAAAAATRPASAAWTASAVPEPRPAALPIEMNMDPGLHHQLPEIQ